MNSFSAYLWKEIIELFRSKKIIIFGIAYLFFAMLDPVMIKILPEILKSQMGNADPESFGFSATQISALSTYAKDMFQTISIVVALTLMGLTASEINNKTVILPKIVGLSMRGFVAAKIVVYSAFLSIITIIGFMVSFFYAGLLFPNSQTISFLNTFLSSLLFSVHFIFLTALCIFFGSLFKKNVLAGILTLAFSYVGAVLPMLLPKLKLYFPYNIIESASSFKPNLDSLKSVAVTLILVIVLCFISAGNLNKSES